MISKTYDKAAFEVLKNYFDDSSFYKARYKDNSARGGTARVAIYTCENYDITLFHSRGLPDMEVSVDLRKMFISKEEFLNGLDTIVDREK